MSGLGLLVTASERAVSTEVPAIDVADTSRGSKRGAEEFRSVEDGEGQKGSTPPVRGSEINNMDEEAADVLDGDIAAIQGDVEIVKRNEGLIFSKKALDGAAGAGHLEMVKWLLKFKPEIGCSVDAMDLASQGRHLDVLEWLNKNSAEGCSRSALVIAAARGDMKTVQWLYSNAMHNGDITEAMDKALETGHAEVAEWLKIHLPNKNKKPRTASPTSPSPSPPAGTTSAESGGASSFQRPAAGGAHSSTLPGMPGNKPCNPMGMFGSPFGNFSPVNGIVLPGPTAQAIVPKQAATGAIPTPPGSGGSGPPRLRSNMLRSPELTLAMSGRLSNTDERQLKAVMEFRKAYSAQALEGSNIPKDPFTLFAVWFEEARIARASEPGAMCLSTVGPTGRPSARYVMLQGFDKRGFVWYTNFESRKAQELSQNPYGALSFWWSEVQRAVRIEGVVCKVTEKESTEYFQSRPRGSQVGAWALHQSRPVESRGSLETNVKDVQNKFSSMRDVPRPTHFGGFRLRPDRIEFWKGRQTRIHDRIVYVIMDDKWIMQRLQP